ncbi:MAG: hypothetical protein ACLFUJ_00180 [Phycisphaerae bacterium]
MRKLTILTLLILASATQGRPFIPPVGSMHVPMALAEAELVFVVDGDDVKSTETVKRNVPVPGSVENGEHNCQTFTTDKIEILGGKRAEAMKGKTLQFISPAISQANRRNRRLYFRPVSFRPGQKYLVVLQKIENVDELFLPVDGVHFRPANDRTIAEAKLMVNPERWSWGRSDDSGLQLGLIIRQPEVRIYKVAGQDRQFASLNVMVMLRNTGDKPVRLSLHPDQKPIKLLAMDDEGTVVEASPYAGKKQISLAYGSVLPKYIQHELAPGEFTCLGPMGLSPYGMAVQIPVKAGKWKLFAIFDGKDTDGGRLWTGEIRSQGVDIQASEGVRPIRPILRQAE